MIHSQKKLSKKDHLVLDSYKYLVKGLGQYLGNGYEIILHSLEDLSKSVIFIVNGHLSGRKVGSPITDFALSMLESIEIENKIKSIVYTNKGKKGCKLKSCTIPIVGEKSKVIGLVCINFYSNISTDQFFENFASMFDFFKQDQKIIENFTDNVDDLIVEALDKAKLIVDNDNAIASVSRNKQIILLLYEKGIFNIKDSVVKVASLLNISKNTVYMHLRSIK